MGVVKVHCTKLRSGAIIAKDSLGVHSLSSFDIHGESPIRENNNYDTIDHSRRTGDIHSKQSSYYLIRIVVFEGFSYGEQIKSFVHLNSPMEIAPTKISLRLL